MAYYPKRKYRRRALRKSSGKKAVVRKALRKSATKRVARVCKRVISSMAEVKTTQTTYTVSPRNQLDTQANFLLNNVIPLSPNNDINPIIQGTNQEQRTGNSITTKYCKGRFVLYPNPYSAINNVNAKPTIVKFWCVSAKDGYMSPSSMSNIFDISMFQEGSTSTGYTSTLVDLISPINKDVLTLHWSRTYKLGHSTVYGNANATTSPGNVEAQWANNDYKMNHIINFDFTKHMKKTFTYNDNTAIPNGKNLFLLVGICYADGRPFSSASTELPVGMYYTIDYGYTDM